MSASESTKLNTDVKWAQMNVLTKLAFLGKLSVMLVTFGFAFPNVLN